MLRDDQYALITLDGTDKIKRYPIDSANNVLASYMEMYNEKELDADERATASYFIKNAAAMYGMELPFEKQAGCSMPNDGPKSTNVVRKLKKKAASLPQYKAFALKGRYPIDNPDLVKRASEYFDEHWRHFDFSSRRVYAKNVQKQASLLGCDTSRMIQKFASDSFSSNLTYELMKRTQMSGSDAFEKLASYTKQLTVDEFSALLGELDNKHRLNVSYNKSLLDPQAATFSDPMEKMAAGSGMQWEIDGITYTQEEMQKGLAHPDVISMYGNSLVNQFRNPEVFDELPVADKKVILQYGSVR